MKSGYKSAFISYSTDGKVKAEQISGYLRPIGVDTYMYKQRLARKSQHPSQEIKKAIRERSTLIMVLSAKSRESQWVTYELDFASGLNKEILIIKTAHNLNLPDYLNKYDVTILNKLEDLDKYFS